jgi:hypothetical protein
VFNFFLKDGRGKREVSVSDVLSAVIDHLTGTDSNDTEVEVPRNMEVMLIILKGEGSFQAHSPNPIRRDLSDFFKI